MQRMRDKEFDYIAKIVMKIINAHNCWVPNPYTLILNSPRYIFHKYAAEHFKALPPELIDAQARFEKALQDMPDAGILQNRYLRNLHRLFAARWHRRGWRKFCRSRWHKNKTGRWY